MLFAKTGIRWFDQPIKCNFLMWPLLFAFWSRITKWDVTENVYFNSILFFVSSSLDRESSFFPQSHSQQAKK